MWVSAINLYTVRFVVEKKRNKQTILKKREIEKMKKEKQKIGLVWFGFMA